MRTYGVDRKDRGCCPGHDKFPCEAYGTKASRRTFRRTTRVAHKRARARARARAAIRNGDND
jgi:hypothetical protein